MSFGGLRIGASGLAAAQRALETAAHNVANANTVGYSRQRIETSTMEPLDAHRGLLGPGATGQGVAIEAITRATDALVTTNHRETAATLASWTTRASYYARAEQVLGPLDAGTSQALADFWNTWEALSQSPESTTGRDQVLDAGRRLALSLNDAHQRVTDLRAGLELDMASTVSDLNDRAVEVAELNRQIKSSRARGDVPNDLLDRRDLAVAELARLAGAQTLIEEDGDARVSIDNLPLVDGDRAGALEVTGPPPTIGWSATGDPAGVSGELGALVELAGTGTDALHADLDQIARELRDVVNGAHRGGFGLDGIDGRDFFAGGGAADLALDAALTSSTVAASASGAPADGNHALVMGGLRNAPGSSGSTVAELVNALQGTLGLEASHAANQRDLAAIVVDDSARLLAEVSGVSTDEELTEMLRYQRAYEASARVITVVDELLDRLINGTGVTR